MLEIFGLPLWVIARQIDQKIIVGGTENQNLAPLWILIMEILRSVFCPRGQIWPILQIFVVPELLCLWKYKKISVTRGQRGTKFWFWGPLIYTYSCLKFELHRRWSLQGGGFELVWNDPYMENKMRNPNRFIWKLKCVKNGKCRMFFKDKICHRTRWFLNLNFPTWLVDANNGPVDLWGRFHQHSVSQPNLFYPRSFHPALHNM